MIRLIKSLWQQLKGEKYGYEILFNPKGIKLKRIK
jgi:hypothetical protein